MQKIQHFQTRKQRNLLLINQVRNLTGADKKGGTQKINVQDAITALSPDFLTSCRELAESGAGTFRILLPTTSGINPVDWYADVLARINEMKTSELQQLLPHRWSPPNPLLLPS